MGFEAFRPVRETVEDLQDKVEDFKLRREALKDERVFEHLKQVHGEWRSGPVKITVEPAFFGSQGIDVHQLASFDDFKKSYVELAEVLDQKKYVRPSPLIVGRIDISAHKSTPDGDIADSYMNDGKPVILAGAELLKDVEDGLRKLAYAIQDNEKPICDINYVIGLSRLGSVAGHFGFDIYPVSDQISREHASHRFAEEANIRSGMDEARAKQRARRRPATLAVISKEKLLRLYGGRA